MRWVWILGLPLLVLAVIAGSDRLFKRTVPLEQRLVSRNETIRQKAQQELLGLSNDAKPALAGRLVAKLSEPDPFVRKWVAISLALVGPLAQEAIPALVPYVVDKEKEVSQAARVALTEIGAPDPAQLPALLQSLKESPLAVRCETAGSIARMGPTAEDAIPAFLDAVQSPTPIPDCIAKAFADILEFLPEAVGRLDASLTAPDSAVRRNAVDVLARLPQKSTATWRLLLTCLAEDSDSAVRRHAAAALALGEAPERGFIPTLRAALRRSAKPEVRLEAMALLQAQDLSPEITVSVLARGLSDPSVPVRQAALDWIQTDDAWVTALVPHLLKRLQDPEIAFRRRTLLLLYESRLRSQEALPVVAQAQRDPDAEVRCLAARQLVEMGASDRVAVRRFSDELRTSAEEFPCALGVLALAGQFMPEDVVSRMIGLLQSKDRAARARAAAVLIHLGARAKPALPALAVAQKDHIPGTDAAARAIRQALPREKRSRR
jgi:HEAT repeat protein